MITIIHGEDTARSREYFISLKQSLNAPITFAAESVTATSLLQILEGGQLFSEEKNIIIESFFGKKSKGKDSEEVVTILNQHDKTTTVLWEGKELSKKDLSLFPKAQVKVFTYPQTLFAFLQGIKPNSPQNIMLFKHAIEHSPIELVFFMMIRQFRMLLALSSTHPEHSVYTVSEGSRDSSPAKPNQNDNTIDEVARMQPWQKSKLTSQARQFSVKQLLDAYNTLYAIEFGQKTGQLPLPLEKSIDIFLLEL